MCKKEDSLLKAHADKSKKQFQKIKYTSKRSRHTQARDPSPFHSRTDAPHSPQPSIPITP